MLFPYTPQLLDDPDVSEIDAVVDGGVDHLHHCVDAQRRQAARVLRHHLQQATPSETCQQFASVTSSPAKRSKSKGRFARRSLGAIELRCCARTFELREVVALFSSDSLSESSKGVDMPCRISTHFAAAFWKDSDIVVGWMPFDRSFCAASSRLPAMTTTVVVPSPASMSCAFDSSTSCKQKSKCCQKKTVRDEHLAQSKFSVVLLRDDFPN